MIQVSPRCLHMPGECPPSVHQLRGTPRNQTCLHMSAPIRNWPLRVLHLRETQEPELSAPLRTCSQLSVKCLPSKTRLGTRCRNCPHLSAPVPQMSAGQEIHPRSRLVHFCPHLSAKRSEDQNPLFVGGHLSDTRRTGAGILRTLVSLFDQYFSFYCQ